MNGNGSRWIVAAAALAVLVAGGAIDATAKKKSKRFFKAAIAGKRFKPAPRYVGLSAGGGTFGLFTSGTKAAKSLRGTSKNLQVSCVNDLSIQTFPFTSTDCLAYYVETRARPLSMKIWYTPSTGVTEVTVDSYEPGVHIAGSFRSVVPGFSDSALPPLTIEGEFRGPVDLGDPNR